MVLAKGKAMAKKATARAKGPLRWGIISTADIGTEQVIPGMLKSREFEVRAIASRSLATARKSAKKLGIPVAYGSYEELLEDPEIDVVYNPLPNHLHVPMTLAAAAHGKHVLCEKPIALTADEAKKLKAASRRVMIGEAFMIRHHPQWIRARKMARSGKLGTLRAIQVMFSYFNDEPDNIRNIPKFGGGALYDIGCYAVVTGRYIFDSEPVRVMSLVDRDPKFKTDRTMSGLLDFGKGRHLTFTATTQASDTQQVSILGTKARLDVVIPYNAPLGGTTQLLLDNGKKLGRESAKPIKIGKADQYQLQAEAFSRAVLGKEKLVYSVEDSVRQMRVIDALFRSEKSRNWEKP
jgi:predicted dehydrogenase